MKRYSYILIVISMALIMMATSCGKNEADSYGAEKDGIVKVAVIDTGISTAAIASEQILPGCNYVTGTSDTDDTIGHGTAVASIILGSEISGVTGVAPNARVIPLVVKSRDNDGRIIGIDAKSLAQVIRDAVDEYHADVINISIGVASGTKELRAAIEYAEKKRVSIVASVGNGNTNGDVLYPAVYPGVIGVGSVDKDNRVSSFSQKSKAVMLVAQGEDYWMASRTGKQYGAKGTSFATAFVSGAIALLLEQNSELSSAEIREILCESALDLCDAGYDEESGYGALQIDKALEMVAE